jgi:membrane-bound lytic murein transglycosylase B
MVAATPPVAVQLVRADARVQASVRAWDGRGTLPGALERPVLREQLIELRLAGDARLYRVTIARLPARLRRDVADDVLAHRELSRLTPPSPVSALRVGTALPVARLRAYYGEGQRRSGVAWQVLAAVNYVETDFGRLREASVAGAQGPMQFMPATWAAYGRGDVHDPHAAILAAARFTATTPPGRTWTPCAASPRGSAATRRRCSPSTRGG